jgi:hypothetical protein
MYSKQHELEGLMEDLIENVIMEAFGDYFSNRRECEVALEILKNKLDEFDTSAFKDLFD